uniref:Uncharacterized protein n=2 Tax=Aureoumbra lagunensis TaxID=44058 RepID=A0A7S3NKS0_9STRA
MLRLRKFASLLFIGGGNELYPSSKSPNSLARAAITQALNQSERDYIFVPSSMDGGINGGNNSEHVNSYALTPKDGPYTMLMPYHFAQRNPGLNNENLSIAFQPEIGSASAPPDLDTLSCFLSTENEPPPFHDLNISDPDWQLHRYLSFSTQIKGNILYNHAYAYADDNLKHISLSDWLAYTKLAQHQQYQLLISSFFSRLFHFYTAVFIWKTQSPWPALRGFLYDFYKLRVNGGWRGIQAAAFALRSVYISNLISLDRCTLVNRANDPWTNISLRYDWFSIVSPNFSSFGNILTNHISVPPTSVLDLPLTIQQPLACLPPCLLRLTTSQGASASWYWRSLTTTNGGFDFSAFGLIRRTRRAIATFSFMNNTAEQFFFEISVPSTSPESLFYPEIVLENQSCHAPYYAVIPHYDDILLIQPGSVVTLSLALLSLSHNEEDDDEEYPPLHFTLEAWNLNIIQSKVAATTTS